MAAAGEKEESRVSKPPVSARLKFIPPTPKPRFSAKPAKAYRPDALKSRRFLKAYLVTFTVIASYLWLKLKGKFFGKTYVDREVIEVHRRNAKRIERTLLELQGLFIKVGQALSILANFL